MAEYKALAQNTLKVVTEVTLNYNGEISIPCAATLPRLKRISADNSAVERVHLIPANKKTSNLGTGYFSTSVNKSSATQTDQTKMGNAALNAGMDYFAASPARVVEIEGKKYFGFSSAIFTATGLIETVNGVTSVTTTEQGVFPAAKIKVVVFVAATGTISTQEIEVEESTIGGVAYTESMSTYKYVGAAGFCGLSFDKGANDIILAIEIEYPKYDVAINNAKTGLQYSLDDGLTFQDVPAQLELSQIEHVVVKNTSETAANIGLTEGGAELTTVPAGATRVIVPVASATCYVS